MDEREIIYERVGNYTKYKLVEMLVEKHKGKFKNLNRLIQYLHSDIEHSVFYLIFLV